MGLINPFNNPQIVGIFFIIGSVESLVVELVDSNFTRSVNYLARFNFPGSYCYSSDICDVDKGSAKFRPVLWRNFSPDSGWSCVGYFATNRESSDDASL